MSLMVRIPAVSIHLGPVAIPAHLLIESAAYTVGFLLYARDRRLRGDAIKGPDRSSVIVAAIVGAALGSKILAWLEDPAAILHGTMPLWPGGRTIAGGLLGGTIAVEWAKHRLGIKQRTGDLFAIPLIVAMVIGRVGCFLGGVEDHTYGIATGVPWAVDFGDGIPRHPLQLYEILFLLILGAVLILLRQSGAKNGALYRTFLISYLAWRLVSGFLAPDPAFAGLDSIQWACAAALVWYAWEIASNPARRRRSVIHG
jgi:prolipoprotein diacylglyceryltransferase